VKRCGKSAPRRRRRRRHGKPHLEQEQIGERREVRGNGGPPCSRVGSLEARGNAGPRGMSASPAPATERGDRTRLTGRLRPFSSGFDGLDAAIEARPRR
jgi:hypothetical protein